MGRVDGRSATAIALSEMSQWRSVSLHRVAFIMLSGLVPCSVFSNMLDHPDVKGL